MDSDNEDIVEILHIDFSLAISNPFGAVSHACMRARSRLLPIRLDADRGVHFNTGLSLGDFGWEALCFAPGKVLLDVHFTDHDDTAHTSLFFLLVRVDRTASRPPWHHTPRWRRCFDFRHIPLHWIHGPARYRDTSSQRGGYNSYTTLWNHKIPNGHRYSMSYNVIGTFSYV
jgi:hypothetical protein